MVKISVSGLKRHSAKYWVLHTRTISYGGQVGEPYPLKQLSSTILQIYRKVLETYKFELRPIKKKLLCCYPPPNIKAVGKNIKKKEGKGPGKIGKNNWGGEEHQVLGNYIHPCGMCGKVEQNGCGGRAGKGRGNVWSFFNRFIFFNNHSVFWIFV